MQSYQEWGWYNRGPQRVWHRADLQRLWWKRMRRGVPCTDVKTYWGWRWMLTPRAKALHPLCAVCRANLKTENIHVTLRQACGKPSWFFSEGLIWCRKKTNTQNAIKPVNPKRRDTQKHTHTCYTVPQVLVFCVFITICLEIMYNTTFKCIGTKIIS